MVTPSSIEQAFCFFHQKWQVYAHSTMEWQKDDIEYAIGEYAGMMNKDLYSLLAQGRKDFLRSHTTFASDLKEAVQTLIKIKR